MRYIVLDTNLFHEHWHLEGADFVALAKIIGNSNSTLLMSELVCSEVENNYTRNRDENIDKLKRLHIKLQDYIIEKKEVSFEYLIQPYDFRKILQDKMKFVIFFDYQKISHLEVVHRALKIIAPFRENEKGYRDTLIWLSLINFLKGKTKDDTVVFITRNYSDFFTKDSQLLQPALTKDIDSNQIPCAISLFTSMSDFIKKNLESDDFGFSEHSISEKYMDEVDDVIEEWVSDYLNNISHGEFKKLLDRSNFHFRYTTTIIDHNFYIDEGMEDGTVSKYGRISSTSLYISYQFNLRRCGIELIVPETEFSIDRKASAKLYYHDVFVSEDGMHFQLFCRPEIELSLILNIESGDISNLELAKMNFL